MYVGEGSAEFRAQHHSHNPNPNPGTEGRSTKAATAPVKPDVRPRSRRTAKASAK